MRRIPKVRFVPAVWYRCSLFSLPELLSWREKQFLSLGLFRPAPPAPVSKGTRNASITAPLNHHGKVVTENLTNKSCPLTTFLSPYPSLFLAFVSTKRPQNRSYGTNFNGIIARTSSRNPFRASENKRFSIALTGNQESTFRGRWYNVTTMTRLDDIERERGRKREREREERERKGESEKEREREKKGWKMGCESGEKIAPRKDGAIKHFVPVQPVQPRPLDPYPKV